MKLWTQLNDKFSALSAREKWLISLGVMAALIFLGFSLLIQPTYQAISTQNRLAEKSADKIRQLKTTSQALSQVLKKDPDTEVDAQLAQLHLELDNIKDQLAGFVDNLVSPTEMAQLLDLVLQKSARLKLVSLQSLPIEPIMTEQGNNIGYFLHPVEIELEGQYFDIQNYLIQLEQMEKQYYWRSFSYEVQEYPISKLTLTVYTIGAKQEFIGG